MAIVGIVIGVLALMATVWGVYYARGQLREAQKVRKENKRFIENQMRDDDLWSEKSVRASQVLCAVAPRFVQGNANRPSGDALCLLFPDYVVRNRILSHLIEKRSGLVYTMRPLDVSQLRLKPTRELIDLVLARIEEFKTQDSELANRIGL
jgi:hypothetical protein